MLGRTILLSLLLSLPVASSASAEGEELNLDQILALARLHDPELRIQEELALQSRLGVHRAWLQLSPTISLSGSYVWNDPVVAFEMAGLDGLDQVLGQQAELTGYLYVQMLMEGMLSDTECVEVAAMYGFADVVDCNGLLGAFIDAADNPPAGDDADAADPVVITPRNQFGFNADLNWYISPRLGSLIGSSKAQAAAGLARAEHTSRQIRYGIYRTYAGLYQAQESMDLAREAVDLARTHLSLAERRVELGNADRSSVLRQRAALMEAEQSLEEASEAHASAARALAKRIARDPAELRVAEPPERELDELQLDADLNALVSAAIDDRLDLEVSRQELRRARIGVTDAGLQWLPDLSLQLHYGYGAGLQDGEWLTSGFSERKDSWRLLVALSWKLWDGGFRLLDAREMSSMRRMAELDLERGRERVRAEVLDALGGVQTARKGLESALARMEVASELLELTEQRAELGVADPLELDSARLGYNQARLAQLSGRLQLDDAMWRLEMALGRR